MFKKILVRPELISHLSAAESRTCRKALHQFIESNTHGANLEKLQGKKNRPIFYSIRANQKSRLILTLIQRNKEQYWVLVNILENHQYDDLRKKNNTWLSLYQDDLVEFQAEETSLLHPDDILPEFIEEPGIEWYHQQFIVLDDAQKNAKAASLPLIISGAPGSGKTNTACALLKEFIRTQVHVGDVKHLIYITQSESLIAEMKKELDSMQHMLGSATPYTMEFKTPKQLLEEHLGNNTTLSMVTQPQHVNHWIAQYFKTKIQLLKNNKHTKDTEHSLSKLAKQPEYIYQEWRTMSGYTSFEDYMSQVSSKHSLFQEPQTRQALWEAYQEYLLTLKNNLLIDPYFHPISSNSSYDFVVIDEAQDLSRRQLKSIQKLAANHQVVYCVGDHQQLFGSSEFIVPFLKSIHQSRGIPANQHTLLASYRCPKKIIQVANALLQLKYQAIGGTEATNKNEVRYVASKNGMPDGSVHWLSTLQELTPLTQDKDNADFAVITSPDYLREAQILFGAERVFLPKEIKGLQYPHILIYRALETNHLKEVNRIIGPDCVLHPNPEHHTLPKNHEGTLRHSVPFNELFVAITRAQVSLSIYQPDVSSVRHLVKPLQQLVLENNKPQPLSQALPTQSSNEEWLKRAQKLREQGHQEKAELIEARLNTQTTIKTITPSQSSKKDMEASKITSTQTKKSKEAKKAVTQEHTKNSQEEIKIRNKLINSILKKDSSALKKILELPQAELYLFDTPLSEINTSYPQVSLFNWLMQHNSGALFKAIKNSLSGDEKKIPKHLFQFLCRTEIVDETRAPPSLIVELLGELSTNKKLARLIKNNVNRNDLTQALNTPNAKGSTILLELAISNSKNSLSVLHALGIDLNTPLPKGSTMAHSAAKLGFVGFLKKLHLLGANLNQANEQDETPIFMAAREGHLEALKELHHLGVSLKPIKAPTFIAAQNGYFEIIKYLLEHDACEATAYNAKIRTLREIAQKKGDESLQKANSFIASKALSNHSEEQKLPILPHEIAEILGYSDIVKLLLNNKTYNPNQAHVSTYGFFSRSKEVLTESVENLAPQSTNVTLD